jgi:hypothetical protein
MLNRSKKIVVSCSSPIYFVVTNVEGIVLKLDEVSQVTADCPEHRDS